MVLLPFSSIEMLLILSTDSFSNYGGVPLKAEYCHEAVSRFSSVFISSPHLNARRYDLCCMRCPRQPDVMVDSFSHCCRFL